MISCTEFIPAYSELFKFIHNKSGKQAVVKFWENLSDAFLANLRDLAASKGLAGLFEYWSHTLTEEASDCRVTLDEEKGVFEIEMRHCPSKGRLLRMKHIRPYEYYCEHCDVLYRKVLEPLGFDFHVDFDECEQAKCRVTATRKKQKKD